MRSCTGAQTAFAVVVRIVIEAIRSSPTRPSRHSPANANSAPSSTV